MADALAVVLETFQERLGLLVGGRDHLLDKVDDEHARELGRRGADAALAPLIWVEAVGERWSTSEAGEFLGVTRQALHDRVKRGTLLGIPGRWVTWFPTWQFNLATRQVRSVVAELITVFRRPQIPLEFVEIGAWAHRARSDLDGLTPADWVADGRDDETVLMAARRSVAHIRA